MKQIKKHMDSTKSSQILQIDDWNLLTDTLSRLPSAGHHDETSVTRNTSSDEIQLSSFRHDPSNSIHHVPGYHDQKQEPAFCECLPDDWTLKTDIIIVTSHSNQLDRRLSLKEFHQVLNSRFQSNHISADNLMPNQINNPDSVINSGESNNAFNLIADSMVYFSFPDADAPSFVLKNWQAAVTALDNTNQKPTQPTQQNDIYGYIYSRIEKWQTSFHSLFYGFRHGYLDTFYVLGNFYTILFHRQLGPDRNQQHYWAIHTDVSPGLKVTLEQHCIDFQIHTVKGNASQLALFEGTESIHGLFEVILSQSFRLKTATDVPILVAAKIFQGATASKLNVTPEKIIQKKGATNFMLQLQGIILPEKRKHLFDALNKLHPGGFEAVVTTDIRSHNLAFISDLVSSKRNFAFASHINNASLSSANYPKVSRIISKYGLYSVTKHES